MSGDDQSIKKSFLASGKDLIQNRIKLQLDEYKLTSYEKGSKIAATTIVSVIQILAFAIFWLFLCFSLGYYLSYEVWGDHWKGFGAIAFFHFFVVLILLILGRPVKWVISELIMRKLDK